VNDAGSSSTTSGELPAYDWLRETVSADLERERARGHQLISWLVTGQMLLLGLYGFCLQQLAAISAQEPATYPKENIPVSSLAWFTAWAVPLLGLGLAALVFWLASVSLLKVQQLMRHWRQSEGLAASTGQRLPAGLYPPLRGGGWGLLFLPILFAALWFAAIRTQSIAIESGIENWRSIPQDQA
jgi:hypothetical protein